MIRNWDPGTVVQCLQSVGGSTPDSKRTEVLSGGDWPYWGCLAQAVSPCNLPYGSVERQRDRGQRLRGQVKCAAPTSQVADWP